MITETEIYQGRDPGATTYSPEDIQKFKDGTYPSTNWDDVAFRKNARLMRHNIDISGGSDRIKYFNSIGYLDEMGLYKSGDLNYQKYNVRSSVTGNITDNLTAQLNIDGIYENKNEPSYDGAEVWHYTRMNKPTFSVYANNNPNYLQDFGYPYHPLAVTNADLGGYRKNKTRTFQGNFSLDYKFKGIQGLSAKFMYGYYNQNFFQKLWRKTYSVYTYDKASDKYLETGIQNKPSTLNGNYSELQRSTILGQLNYERLFLQKHFIKASLAYEERQVKSDNMWAQKEFAIDVDQFFAGMSANAQVGSGNIYENANQNVIGRLNYDFSSKYLFEVGFNYGGSSMFPKGSRWGFFPFSSVGWRISEENFFKDNISFVTDLKIRGSLGQMGDDNASAFQFLTGYTYPNGYYIFNKEVVSGLGFRGMPNPNITWFTVTSKNIGADISLLNGLMSMELDFFQRDRSGLLANRALSIPASVGANLPEENLNKDMRRGFEFVIGHKNSIRKFTYQISSNLTYARGRKTYIERATDGNSYLNWKNNTTDRWDNMRWGYKLLGQFQTTEEILTSPIQDGQGNRTLSPGDFKYEDVNRDGILSDLDMIPITRGKLPDLNYGFNTNLSWKKFDLNIFLQGAANYNFEYRGYSLIPNRWGRNSLTTFFDRWHHEDIFNPDSPLVPGLYPQTGATVNVLSNTWPSVFWLPDASYLRLKNLEMGYTIDHALLKKASIQSMRISVSGFNLYTWTKMRLLDPEQVPDLGWSDNNSYPITRNISMGLNVTF